VDKSAGIGPVPAQFLYYTYVTGTSPYGHNRGLHVANQLYFRARFMWTTAEETPSRRIRPGDRNWPFGWHVDAAPLYGQTQIPP
jgi:hypothetical protein